MNWFNKRIVLVPVDFSDESIAAIDVALDAVLSPSQLHVLHVLPIIVATEPGIAWEAVSDPTRRENTESALHQRIGAEKYRGVLVTVRFGNPAEEIITYAAEIHADMIVLPSHGRTGLKRLLIGSVAERVCRHSHCPVLVLRS